MDAPAPLIVADHVLTDTVPFCELGLSQPGLQTGTAQQVADGILLHFLPVRGALDRDEFVLRLFRKNGNVVLLLDPGEQFLNTLAMDGQFSMGLFHESQHNTPVANGPTSLS